MVNFAVLGCGRIGRMHARNIKAHPRAELVSVYDVVAKAAAETAAELGAKAIGSVDDALNDPKIDAVFIASSTDTHVDLITSSAKAGKAVLCEKPIDLDIARVEACWNEIGKLDPLVMIGFNRRFDPSFKALRDRIQGGELGQLEQVVITSRDPAPPPAQARPRPARQGGTSADHRGRRRALFGSDTNPSGFRHEARHPRG
jgi:myo-inositol 2-dehydrogenase / D-chiro-inositol 1-dehydrogenase